MRRGEGEGGGGWVPKNIVVVNKAAFDKLDANVQAAVLEAAANAEARGWEMSMKETAEKIAILKENGMNIVTPSAELMDGLKQVGSTMLEEWKKDAGAEGEALLKAFGN